MNEFIDWIMGIVSRNALGGPETRPGGATGDSVSGGHGAPISQPGALAAESSCHCQHPTPTEKRAGWLLRYGDDDPE